MWSTGGGGGDLRAGTIADLHVADGDTFEIRYVDPSEAALWVRRRGFMLNQEGISPTVLAYFD